MTAFENSRWIWLAAGEGPDQYVEFEDSLSYAGRAVLLRLSCDTDYTLYVNDVYVASNQYADYEHYKIYDTLDLTSFLQPGENRLRFVVYHCGVSTSRYRPAAAGLIYEVEQEGRITLTSRPGVPSPLHPAYHSGRQHRITGQLGFSFAYDANREGEGTFTPSVTVEKACAFFPRPIGKATVGPRRPMHTVTAYSDRHYLVDLGGEVVGLPTLELTTAQAQQITVAFGEHIADGGVRRIIGERDFSFEYIAKPGHNEFTDYMLRLGCRFLEVTAQQPLELHYAGVLPQVYEVRERPVTIEDPLDRRIYDVCINTLKLCMMEHYVDCPWREQALYVYDSRNQMLCGYDAFEGGNAPYARANLKLISEDRRTDGLLSICYPCGTLLAIPSFSLYYLLAMKEYIHHTGDCSLARETLEKLRGICDEFLSRRRQGLVVKFPGEEMWNFYDWTPSAEGKLGSSEEAIPDLPVNCLTVLALDSLQDICSRIGQPFPYDGAAEDLRRHIRRTFLCDNGLYTLHQGQEQFTELGNALAVLAGVATGQETDALCEALVGDELEECTLSMKILTYTALLDTDTEKYRDTVLSQIRRNYLAMLAAGADTVWETLEGESAFDRAGSLCHGWSAVPVHIFHRLGIAR